MARIVKIVSSSLGTLEHVSPPYNLLIPRLEDNVRRASDILDAAARYEPDLVLLPETFALAGMPASEIPEVAEDGEGPIVQMLKKKAKDGRMNMVAGHLIREGDHFYNRALVLNRDGRLVGYYDKMYPVGSEALAGVKAGANVGTFDLDFGRIGAAICFDINWPSLWSEMARREIDVACWLSAYDGGFPLRCYAWEHQYPIVSSVFSYHARLYDITGEQVTLTTRWQRLGYLELNLDRQLFHTDNQMHKLLGIQSKYGQAIRLKSLTEEHLFTIESFCERPTVEDIISEFELETYRAYIARCSLQVQSELKLR